MERMSLHNFRFPRIETTGVGQNIRAPTLVVCSVRHSWRGWPGGDVCHPDGDPCRGQRFCCREAVAGGHVAVVKCASCAFREDVTARSKQSVPHLVNASPVHAIFNRVIVSL